MPRVFRAFVVRPIEADIDRTVITCNFDDSNIGRRLRLPHVEAYVYLITGRVQGVGFRWFTEREARRLEVRGFVRNLADGRVEVLAQAPAETLRELEARLRQGPSSARVEDVERRSIPVDEDLAAFRVRHDALY